MRLYLVRHADPDYENNTITAAGHLEAAALAKRMVKEGLTRIYCSPLQRAIETAKYSAEALGIEPIIEDWTCEVSECYFDAAPEGKVAVWDTPGELIRAESPWPTHEDWHRIDAGYAEIVRQKFEEVRRCSDTFLARHGYERIGGRYAVRQASRERIAIFCHNGTALWWLAHLLELPLPLVWSGFWHAPSAVTTILFEERSKEWAVPKALCVADTSHLYAAGLPIRPRGIMANYD
jgi:broad specificity phosphatase PhoE